jgi:hypothetical protein
VKERPSFAARERSLRQDLGERGEVEVAGELDQLLSSAVARLPAGQATERRTRPQRR